MSETTVRRLAGFDKGRRIMYDGPRRVQPDPLPAPKWLQREFEKKDEKAPWSGPRGYETTIREEAFAFKAAMREMRRQEALNIKKNKVVPVGMKPEKPKRLKKTRSWHLRGLMPSLRIKERLTRFIGTMFCIRADAEAYIDSQKVDGVIG